MRLDSAVTTRHYPDGNSRRIVTRHNYGSIPAGSSAGKPVARDTLALNALSPIPHSTVHSFGNEYFMTCDVRSEDVATPFFRTATQKGFARLPVTRKWKSYATGFSVDSIEIRREYSAFNGMSPLTSRIVMLRGGETAAVQTIKSYDGGANITSMTEADGTSRRYTWYQAHRLLASASIVTGNGSLTSYYTIEPLVGYTSIMLPSGSGRIFSYSGGRLSSERNTAGLVVATHRYSLHADGGSNMTSVTTYNDSGSATVSTYYDGFGLPVQTVASGAGTAADEDVCSFTEYDGLDRPVRQWQPVSVSGLDGICSVSDMRSFAASVYGSDSRPFTETTYYASAGQKVCAVYSPGDAFADYPARTEYLCNNTTNAELTVRRYAYLPPINSIGLAGNYPKGTLDAVKSVDPDGHTVLTFTDWRGFKILERRIPADNDFLDTYYVNDCWGEPLVVLQPEAVSRLTQNGKSWKIDSDDTLSDYAFIYRYDRCGRLIYKKIPGCEPVTYRYDSYGRLAYMQDGNMRAAGRAMFTIYDEASRVAVTGLCDDDAMAANVNIPTMTAPLDETAIGICGTGYLAGPHEYLQNAELLTATYYDNYDFLGLTAFSDLPAVSPSSYASAAGLPTGSLTAVLGEPQQETIDDGPTVAVPFQPIASVTFYDTEERPVKTVSTTHLAGTHEQTETTYTLDSQPKTVRHTLKYNDYTYNDNYQYSYDRVGRLAGVKASLPWANLIDMNIGADAYNSIGQLVSSGSGSSATTYSYDIRGAISGLSNSAVKQSITRNANGTISKKIDNGIAHTFEYDNAGRLLSETCDNSDNHTGIFSSTYTYDRNSNITSLTRTGYPGGMSYPAYPVDDLKMTYDGNRLVKVADHADEVIVEKSFDFYDGSNSAAEYAYDDNGNVIRDSNRRLTGITYNALNQPSHIEVGNDAASEAIMDYIYDGAGKKLGTRSRISYFSDRPLTTYAIQEPCRAEDHDYIGNYEFKDGQVHRVNTPYGYIAMGCFFPYLRDYQGNNRNHASYYAYGLPVQGSEVKDPDPYLYSGKEFYSLRGVNLYDFNARTYAPDIARFMQPDPKADDYNWLSPYAYCGGDPINKVDLTGMDIYEFNSVGALANIIKEPRYDLVRIKTSSGRIQERVFERGTIYGIKKVKFEGAPQSYYFKVKGVENSDNIYMMLATNTSAEWSLVRSKDKETGSIENYIGTSQDSYQERTGAYVMRKVMNHEENILERDIHSHPDNSMPSGFPEDKKPGVPENGDIPLARIIQELYPYFDDFELLRVKSLRIERYNKDSRKNDFINYLQEIYIN